MYEVQDIGELEVIKTYLYSEQEFIELDKRGHQMYSAGFNHYYKFASGKGFTNIQQQIEMMDIEVPIPEKNIGNVHNWKRSSIIKMQSIESAGYQCEISPKHTTFTSKSTGHQYMEGHHALPMKYQDKFEKSLDVYANIICLCPICHRLLHYGVTSEKENVLDKIYYDRSKRLAVSGIKVSRSEFESLVI